MCIRDRDNSAAIKVYTACGFTEEGVLREDVYKQGEFKDVLIMSILSYEFQILDRGKLWGENPREFISPMTNQRPLRIVVFSPYCLLRPTTNRIFDMRLCDSFAGHNVPVTIVYPYAYMKGNISAGKIPKSYGLQHPVGTRMLLTPLRETSSKYTFLFWMMIGFGFSTIRLFFSSLFVVTDVLIVIVVILIY